MSNGGLVLGADVAGVNALKLGFVAKQKVTKENDFAAVVDFGQTSGLAEVKTKRVAAGELQNKRAVAIAENIVKGDVIREAEAQTVADAHF